jgi:hypothetical protein
MEWPKELQKVSTINSLAALQPANEMMPTAIRSPNIGRMDTLHEDLGAGVAEGEKYPARAFG